MNDDEDFPFFRNIIGKDVKEIIYLYCGISFKLNKVDSEKIKLILNTSYELSSLLGQIKIGKYLENFTFIYFPILRSCCKKIEKIILDREYVSPYMRSEDLVFKTLINDKLVGIESRYLIETRNGDCYVFGLLWFK